MKVSAHHCPLRSLDFVTPARERRRVRPVPVCQGQTSLRRHPCAGHPYRRSLDRTQCTFYLDTSGEPLFKRGWRKSAGEAPIRENLAAGILRLAQWTPDTILYDPMCGSGTFVVEAALMARRMAPASAAGSRSRSFSPTIPAPPVHCVTNSGRELSAGMELIHAADQSAQALTSLRANLTIAGCSEFVTVRQGDARNSRSG